MNIIFQQVLFCFLTDLLGPITWMHLVLTLVWLITTTLILSSDVHACHLYCNHADITNDIVYTDQGLTVKSWRFLHRWLMLNQTVEQLEYLVMCMCSQHQAIERTLYCIPQQFVQILLYKSQLVFNVTWYFAVYQVVTMWWTCAKKL